MRRPRHTGSPSMTFNYVRDVNNVAAHPNQETIAFCYQHSPDIGQFGRLLFSTNMLAVSRRAAVASRHQSVGLMETSARQQGRTMLVLLDFRTAVVVGDGSKPFIFRWGERLVLLQWSSQRIR